MKNVSFALIMAGVAVVTISVLSYFNHIDREERAIRELKQELVSKHRRATDFLKEVTYVKDPRTGACFALYQVSISGIYREFVTAVPCEGIPTNLLIIPDMGTNINNIAK